MQRVYIKNAKIKKLILIVKKWIKIGKKMRSNQFEFVGQKKYGKNT